MNAAASLSPGPLRGRRGMVVLLVCLVAVQLVVKRGIHAYRREGETTTENVSSVIGAGEQVGAALLGGFRAILLNILWVRVQNRLERREYLELPQYLAAIRELQGNSPWVYIVLSHVMCMDIAKVLEGQEEERWLWIGRGLAVLEEGRRRFPESVTFLWHASTVYYLRFHPMRAKRDRERYLLDAELNPSGRDPLRIARDLAEKMLAMEDHGPREHDLLVALLKLQMFVLVPELRLLPDTEAASGRLADPRVRADLQTLVDRFRRLLNHMQTGHEEVEDSPEQLSDWKEVLAVLERMLK